MGSNLVELGYLISAVLFILGLKGLTRPRTAVEGNLLGALGMFVAVVVTVLARTDLGLLPIAIGIAAGAANGDARTARLTSGGKIKPPAARQRVGSEAFVQVPPLASRWF